MAFIEIIFHLLNSCLCNYLIKANYYYLPNTLINLNFLHKLIKNNNELSIFSKKL